MGSTDLEINGCLERNRQRLVRPMDQWPRFETARRIFRTSPKVDNSPAAAVVPTSPVARDQRQVLGPETRESRQLRLTGESPLETLTWIDFPVDANRRALSGGVSGSFSQFGKKSEIEARHLWVTWEINS
jgi:hypothetical protein